MVHTETDLALFVRSGDYDRFLCIQLAPAPKRAGLYAITAFSIELARIAEVVSDALIGHIRLAWWREALEEIAAGKTPRNHPVVLALAELHQTHPQIFMPLHRMIEARAADLDETLLAEEADWFAYLDGTAGALHQAWAMLLDADAAADYAAPIAQQARAYAMIGLLRAIPYHAQQQFQRFPSARMPTLAPGPELQTAVQALLAEAQMQLTAPSFPKILKPLRGLSRLARLHAVQLNKQQGNPYHLRSEKLAAAMAILMVNLRLI